MIPFSGEADGYVFLGEATLAGWTPPSPGSGERYARFVREYPELGDMLSRGETLGVFQMAGSGMTAYLKDLRPTVIHDLNAMVALYRPGPSKGSKTSAISRLRTDNDAPDLVDDRSVGNIIPLPSCLPVQPCSSAASGRPSQPPRQRRRAQVLPLMTLITV